MHTIRIGWGEASICPRPGKLYIAGAVPFRTTDVIHDELKATAMIVESDEKRIIWLSCDFCHPSKQIEDRMIELLYESLPNFSKEQFILSATHATACFYMSDTEILNSAPLLAPPDGILPIAEAREQFCRNAVQAVLEASRNMEYEDIEGADLEILTGYCRRTVYKDGSAVMYGTVAREDFLRMEYPDGGATKVLYFYESGTRNLRAVLAAAPCPAQADESSNHITADYWGYARNILKEHFGESVKLLSLCRAAGELSPHRMFVENFSMEFGTSVAIRIGKHIAENIIYASKAKNKSVEFHPFDYIMSEISFPIRAISKEEYLAAKRYIENASNYDSNGKALDWQNDSEARHIVKFGENGVSSYNAKVHVLRIGRLVFFTAPAELFCEYAKQVIARFTAYTVFDIQLTHDSIGYLPTKEAIMYGGYSTTKSSAFTDEIGRESYVETICEMIRCLM